MHFFVFFKQCYQIDAQYDRGCDRKGSKDIFHFIWTLRTKAQAERDLKPFYLKENSESVAYCKKLVK